MNPKIVREDFVSLSRESINRSCLVQSDNCKIDQYSMALFTLGDCAHISSEKNTSSLGRAGLVYLL